MRINIWNTTKAVLAAGVVLFTACQPDEFELGDLLKKEELKYSITQDASDPNAIVLQAQNPGHQPFWITPMGRSTLAQDTVRIPFEGEYSFVYGVISAGGVVQADTFKLNLTTTNLNYVNDPLWTLLSGGVGEEKTWYLDLNAEEESRYFAGPLYFYGTDDSWATVTDGEDIEGDSWNWSPDWKGNSWLMPAADYGSMTFSLKGNAVVRVDHTVLGKIETGTYFLDVKAKTIQMTDAAPLHDEGRDGQVINWGDLRVMSLTENTLQLGVIRDEALSGEGPALLVYNYVSKDYYDNWVPADVPDPEPQLPADWKEDVSQVVSTTITWKLSTQNPLDWANLDGSRMNGWNAPEDYPDWLGTPDPSVYEGFSLVMNSADGSVVYTAPDGTQEEGSFTLDNKGIYTFEGIAPSFSVIGWASFGLTAENQLRILSIEKDPTGNLSGMWVGAKDPVKPEYSAYHLVPSMGGSSDAVDPAEATRKAIVKALTGSGTRTFKPDPNWFVDWVGVGPDFSGGWTSAEDFGEDYTSNGWVWDAAAADIVESASLEFTLVDGNISLTVRQVLTTEHEEVDGENSVWVTDEVDEDFSQTGTVVIDPEGLTLTFDIPLIDYAGSAPRWLSSEGNEGTWFIVPHGDSSLSTVEAEGLWLGYSSSEEETTILHYVIE